MSPGQLLEENARLAQKMAQDVEAARKEAEVQREDARQAREAWHNDNMYIVMI